MENFLIFKALLALLTIFFIGYVPVYFLFEYKKGCQKDYKKNSNTWDNAGHGIIDPGQPDRATGFSGFCCNDGFNDRHNISKQIFIFFISIYFGFFIISNYLIMLSLLKIKFSFLNAAVFSLVFCAAFIFIQILKFKKAKLIGEKGRWDNQKGNENNRKEHDENQKVSGLPQIDYKINQEETKGAQKEKTGKTSLIFQVIFVFLIFINFCVVAFFTFLFPIRFWDAISCWSFKGRAFFLDGSVNAFYTQHQYAFTHLTYPLYISLSQTWVYIWLGEINETLVKAIFPLFYMSLIFIVYYLLRKEVTRLYAIISAFILSTLPVIMDHGYLEYTNLIFSVILLLGVYYLYFFILKSRESQNQNRQVQTPSDGKNVWDNLKNLIISAVFFAILVYIRSEGILFLAIFLLINTVYNLAVLPGSFSSKRSNIILNTAVSIFLPATLIFILMAPWTILQAKLNISGASTEWAPVIESLKDIFKNILKGSMFVSGGLKEIFNKSTAGSMFVPDSLKNILNGTATGGLSEISSLFSFKNASGAFLGEFLFSKFDSARAFLGSSYGIAWIALAVMAVFNFKKLFKAFNWIFLVFLSAGFIALFISLGFIAEFAWSTERYMLHLFPLAYFWIMRSYLSSTILLKSFAPEK